jgi:hypothetical protein
MQRQPKDKDAICQSTHCEERIFPVAREGTPLKKAASFFFIELVILQVEVDGCAGIVVLIAQASWAKGRWLIVACFDDDGKWTYVVKSVHPVAPSTQQPTWPAVLLAKELSTVQETQMTNSAREALIAFLSDQIDTRGQSSRTETTRGCRVRVPVSRLRIDGAAAGAKRPAPTQEKKRTPAQEKKRCMHCGKDFHVRGIFKHQAACKIEEASSSSSDSDEVKPPRVATKPGTSSGQSSGQAELLASLNEMLVKALQQSTVAVPTMVACPRPRASATGSIVHWECERS